MREIRSDGLIQVLVDFGTAFGQAGDSIPELQRHRHDDRGGLVGAL